MRVRLPGRFEWKILGAMLLVAVMSFGIAAYTLRFALSRLTESAIARHTGVGEATGRALELFRGFFSERKDEFRRRARKIADHPPTRLSELQDVEGLLRARLLQGTTVVDSWDASAQVVASAREAPAIVVELAPGPPARVLELTFGIPVQIYESFVALNEAVTRDLDMDRAYDAFVPTYLREMGALIIGVLVLAPLLGLYLARRVTHRVARLSDAARAVGAGDLSVEVRPTGKDELDELGRAFDSMVTELRDARSRLEYLQKVSAWQEVARRLAHEIKNPLTPIQLSVQELASKYRGDDPGYQRLLATALEILHEEITGLRRLVDDFSAFSKLPKVEPIPVDLSALVTELVRLQPEWQPHVEVVAPGTPVAALCDKTLFRRVLANLIENAFQAARAAGREPRVRISVEARPGRRAAILVADNGPGVPAADRHRIFDPYVTYREGGTGLGLAIVRKIVIDHGGDVTVDQAGPPLGGACFVVEIAGA